MGRNFMTPNELATELGISPKQLRSWLRSTYPRTRPEHGTSWYLSNEHAAAARQHFRAKPRSTFRTVEMNKSSPVRPVREAFNILARSNATSTSQVDWQWCQRHAIQTLVSGSQCLLHRPLRDLSELESVPGIYLAHDASDRCIYVGQSSNIKRRVHSHIKSNSEISRHLRSVRELKVTFGRLELEQLLISSLQPRLNSGRRKKIARLMPANTMQSKTLWGNSQESHLLLIEQGVSQALDISGESWFNTALPTTPGVYILRDPDGNVLYIGETHDIAERFGSHRNDTYFSALRRNAGRVALGLKFAPGSRRHFSPKDDQRVTAYLARCNLAIIPVSIGRGELESGLIRHLNPLLNRRR